MKSIKSIFKFIWETFICSIIIGLDFTLLICIKILSKINNIFLIISSLAFIIAMVMIGIDIRNSIVTESFCYSHSTYIMAILCMHFLACALAKLINIIEDRFGL